MTKMTAEESAESDDWMSVVSGRSGKTLGQSSNRKSNIDQMHVPKET
jgi:hypothetical protein